MRIYSGNTTLSNNVSTPTNIPALNFQNGQSFSLKIKVSIDANVGDYYSEVFTIDGLYTFYNPGYVIYVDSIGDNTGVTFSIDLGGQIQYTSTNFPNWVVTYMSYYVTEL